MGQVIALVLPFFGLIFLGFGVAKWRPQPLEALGWMNTFIIYVALPALFFVLLSQTPIEKLGEWRYIFASVFTTYLMFSLMFGASAIKEGSSIPEATIKGLAAAYGNIGYMGPGIALLAFGPEAAVPVALIFCFENVLHFAIAPLMMAISGGDDRPLRRVMMDVVQKIALHPFILATIVGVLAAYFKWVPPIAIGNLLDILSKAAAPCALFAMGVTLAMRPVNRIPSEIALIAPIKLILHPVLCYLVLSIMGDFDPVWVYAAVLLAALPTATNVFVIAQQYDVYTERASAAILITTTLSVLTVSMWLFLITNGYLPPDLFPSS